MSASARQCILVIEDDPSVRALYRMLFDGEGYRVETATDGQDGLHQLGCAPDLIVLDLMMPVMDGHEFLHQLARLPVHAHTPVLVVSAELPGSPPRGASATMCKPFDMSVLLGKVAGMLAG